MGKSNRVTTSVILNVECVKFNIKSVRPKMPRSEAILKAAFPSPEEERRSKFLKSTFHIQFFTYIGSDLDELLVSVDFPLKECLGLDVRVCDTERLKHLT